MRLPVGFANSLISVLLIPVFAVLAVITVASEVGPSVWAQSSGELVTVPIPVISGPIPVTEDSHPFAAANIAQTEIDLSAYGYVEEEFFISGSGSVYDWEADGGLSVRTEGLEYTTRILVRRPGDVSNFSGTVLVDVANQGAGFDTYALWGQLNQHLLSRGHAWVAVTVFARNIGSLRMFDIRRYGNLAYPQPVEECGRVRPDSWDRPAQFFPKSEDGIRWDVISQVGALLKSAPASSPLSGFDVEYVYAGMQSGGDLPTYANAVHRNVRLANGDPVFDGYLIKDSGGPRSLNACADALGDSDPRRLIRNAGAPVIQIIAQGSISPSIRRPDSDLRGDRFRQYEVPGASHFDESQYRYYPPVEDLAAMGVPPISAQWIFPAECEPFAPINSFPVPYVFAGAFANLDRWVREDIAPPRTEFLALSGSDFINDEFGNALGGLRTPWLDVPTAAFFPSRTGGSTPFRCGDNGYWVPFSWQQLEAMYGSFDGYAQRFLEAVDRLVDERWVTPEDGENIRSEMRSSEAF
jgi:hypothetical protein